jgi:Na+-transporting methylmalonyl-CoA/oxaloacetate decarboxylase gamma subunit
MLFIATLLNEIGRRIAEGKGLYLTAFGMGVVFLGLTVLYLFVHFSMKLMGGFKEREKRKDILRKISYLTLRRRSTADFPYGPENTADVNDEVVAAITLALNLYFTMYENPDQMAKLTKMIKIKPSTPWVLHHRSDAMQRNTNRLRR